MIDSPRPPVGFDGAEVALQDLLGELAAYKVPDRIAVVDALPRNAMGKVVRADLPALL